MEAIDTNVLVRYIVGDDEIQAKKAIRLIETGEPKLINPIVIVELSWVLSSVYKLRRRDIADTLGKIGSCGYLFYKTPWPVATAIKNYANGYDLADALILGLNVQDGATVTYTSDKKASQMQGYALLK